MPRRNLYLLFAVALVSLACYVKADSAYRSRYGQMSDTFIEALKQIDRNYIEPVEERRLFEAALTGMINQLGDPYSAYEPPQEALEFRQQLDQKFGGIGVEVVIDPATRRLTVTSPMIGTPAFEAGILAGDQIVAIDGETTEGMEYEEARRRMRGEPGESVTLSILHPGETTARDIQLVRAIIKIPSVLGDTRDESGRWNYVLADHPEIGYVRIISFGEQTLGELEDALRDLEKRQVRGLIIDLRHNFGGILRTAVGTCDHFVKGGIIVTTRGRDKKQNLEAFRASGKGRYGDWPMVVLVDHWTASAAEIVAACLQDHHRAIVIGERTWGKGTVQNVIPLEGGKSALKLTVATYWRPNEINIHRSATAREEDEWGVKPDQGFGVPLSQEEQMRAADGRRKRDMAGKSGGAGLDPVFDPPLDKAVEYLKHRLAKPSLEKVAQDGDGA
ncbi:MAG TPA: S41 family peptidase [Pirellulales bacterium]|nr:S41 family peptidase [Pirellulales bacterium]